MQGEDPRHRGHHRQSEKREQEMKKLQTDDAIAAPSSIERKETIASGGIVPVF